MSEPDGVGGGASAAGASGGDPAAARAARADGGPRIVSLLADIDLAALSRRGQIDALVALERVKGWAEAQQQQVLASLAREGTPTGGVEEPLVRIDGQLDKQWVREEVACALRVAAPTAAARLALATELTSRFPQTLDLLAAGRVSAPMARRLAESTLQLDDAAAAAVQARVLPRAGGQTFSQFAQAVRRAVLAADPRSAEKRHADAKAERGVRVRPLEDGMAELSAVHSADAITAAYAAINDAAQAGSTSADNAADFKADDRSADQRRADALIDLLTCPGSADASEPTDGASNARRPCRCGQRPAVLVTVAASTLLGLDGQPGELAGYGPIPAALARAIAADPTGTWRRLVTDPAGRLLDFGRTTYRPPAALADHVRTRDWTCRFPTCNRRAESCELDHALA